MIFAAQKVLQSILKPWISIISLNLGLEHELTLIFIFFQKNEKFWAWYRALVHTWAKLSSWKVPGDRSVKIFHFLIWRGRVCFGVKMVAKSGFSNWICPKHLLSCQNITNFEFFVSRLLPTFRGIESIFLVTHIRMFWKTWYFAISRPSKTKARNIHFRRIDSHSRAQGESS